MAKDPKTVRILNRAHTGLTLTEPMPNPEKPGDAPPLRSFTLGGTGSVSEVDAEAYSAWKKGNPNHTLLTSNMLEEVGDDYEAPEDVFGHEPALEAVAKEASTEPGPVAEVEAGKLSGDDMTPTNATPPGDDPGEPRHASQPGEPEPAVVAVARNTFTAVFPEFADAAKFPGAAVDFWLTQAGDLFPSAQYGTQTDMVTMLYVAHNLTLGILGASGGGAGSFAPVTSKSVGGVSKSMDTTAVTSAGAGIWNGTAYGQRLYAFLRGFSTGGFYRPSVRAAAQRYPYGRL